MYVPATDQLLCYAEQWNYGNETKDLRIHYYNVGTASTYKTMRLSLAYGR